VDVQAQLLSTDPAENPLDWHFALLFLRGIFEKKISIIKTLHTKMCRVTETNMGETISVHIRIDHMPLVGIPTIFYYYFIIFWHRVRCLSLYMEK